MNILEEIPALGNTVYFICKIAPWLGLFYWLLYSTRAILGKLKKQPAYYLFENIPNVFVSLGLLGTFLGITYGLLYFDTDPKAIKTSIQELLSGLKIAFATSITGMILSLFFNRIVKIKLSNGFIEEPPSPESKILSKINDSLHKSINNQNKMVSSLDTNLKNQNTIIYSLENFSKNLANANSNAIQGALEEIIVDFNNTFKTLIGQLVDKNFEKLTESIDNLISWQIEYRQEIIQIKETYESISENHKIFVSNTDNWVNNLEKIAGKSSELKKLVDDFQAAFNDESRFKEVIYKIGSTTDNLNQASDALKVYTEKISTAERSFKDVSNNVSTWLNKEEGVREMVNSLQHALSQLREFDIAQVEDLDKRFTKRLEDTFKGLDDVLHAQLTHLERKRSN